VIDQRLFWRFMLAFCWAFFPYNLLLMVGHMSGMPEHPVGQTFWATFSAVCAMSNAYTAGIFWRLLHGRTGWDAL
jgi:hypothetical protein